MFKRTKVCLAALTAIGAATLPGWAAAQSTTAQRVEITGSAIKRIDAETSVPIQVIRREDIARSGVQSTEELVASIAAISSQGGIANATGAGSSTYGRSTISLRGLESSRTLVLVNGRRVAPAAGGGGATGSGGAAVNVNNIPLAAIERVEVLKDGASSIYGSEALAGVVNFILTRSMTGIDVGVSAGTPTRTGGGQNYKATIVGGFGDINKDRFNLTASFAVEKERPLFAANRDFAKTGNVSPWITAGATGQGNIEGGYIPGTGSVGSNNWVEGTRVAGFGNSPGAGFGNPLAFGTDSCASIRMFKNLSNSSKGAPFCAYDSAQDVGLVPDREATAFTLNGAWRLSNSVELFSDAMYSKSVVAQLYQPSPVRRSFLTSDALFQQQGVDPALLLFPSNPNYATARTYLTNLRPTVSAAVQAEIDAIIGAPGAPNPTLRPIAITSRVFDFGGRGNKDTLEQTRLVIGGRGEFMQQSYEVAAFMNESELTGTVTSGYFSQVAYARAVQNSSDWNPWSLNQSASFKSAIAGAEYKGKTQDAKSTSNGFDAKLSGDLFTLPGGMVQYAAGLQHRDDKYQTDPSAALFSGDIAGLGGATPAVDRSRKITSVFGELNVPIIKSLEGSVSYRRDDYDDVGAANTRKVSLRWAPVRQVVLRASTGTGFRAPTLAELWLPQTTGTSEQFTDPAFPSNPNLQVPLVSGGNPKLKPETSKQQSFGIVLQPIDSLTVGVDIFRIKVNGIITTPSTQEVVSRFRSGDPAYAGLVLLDAGNNIDEVRAISANVGSAIVEGADVDINFRQNLIGGRLDVGLAGTYMGKFDQTSPSGTVSRKVGTMVEGNGDPVLGADGGGVILRWKHRLSGTFTTGAWGFTLAQNFYKGYRTGDRQIDGEKNFVPDQSIFDAQVAYSGIKNTRIALGVKNLMDKNPPIFVPTSNQFQAGYDITQYDPRSRFVYLAANYRF
jgi:iron complex outermembrane receptor protein